MKQIKKIAFFLIVSVATSLFATDVSNFDIKGIKLGMSKEATLKRLPHGTIFRVFSDIAGNPNYPYEYDANYIKKGEEHKDFLAFGVTFGHTLQAYEIHRNIGLDYNANINKIMQQVILRYGKPDFFWKRSDSDVALCWGNCYKGKYHYQATENGKILYIQINTDDNPLLQVELEDDKLYNENVKYEEKLHKKAKDELENKASKVDL
jgi:hypothetical protein